MPTPARSTRDRLLEFELELDALVCDELVEHEWGRAYLTPSLPLVWDASWVLVERPGLEAEAIEAIADATLGEWEHRTVAFRDEADGTRAAAAFAGRPGWTVERALYMAWDPGSAAAREALSASPRHPVAERRLGECEDLRRQLIRGELPAGPSDPDAATAQLLELDRRYGDLAGDRWFLAPAAEPASACRLFNRGGVAQVEEVVTLAAARERGLGRAVIAAGLAAASAAEAATVFIVADADDWPQLLYAQLGFEPVGGLTFLSRKPS